MQEDNLKDLQNWVSANLQQDWEELTSSNFILPEESDYVDFEDSVEEWQPEGFAKAAEYQGKKVTLNKPFRTPKGPKKFGVYTKNDKGNVVLVRFGDPNLSIKRDNPQRRKAFRARHKCDDPGPKWKARYWSCRQWRANAPVED